MREVGRRLGVSGPTVKRHCGRLWTAIDTERRETRYRTYKRLRDRGFSYAKIGERYAVTPSAVLVFMERVETFGVERYGAERNGAGETDTGSD